MNSKRESYCEVDYSCVDKTVQELFKVPVENVRKQLTKLYNNTETKLNTIVKDMVPDYICYVFKAIKKSLDENLNYTIISLYNVKTFVRSGLHVKKINLDNIDLDDDKLTPNCINLKSSIRYIFDQTTLYFERVGFVCKYEFQTSSDIKYKIKW